MARPSTRLFVFAVALTACGSRAALRTDGSAAAGTGGGGAPGVGGSTGGGGATGDAGAFEDAGSDGPAESLGPRPGAFSLTSPVEDPLTQDVARFSWSASVDAVSYEVDLSTSPSFTTSRRLMTVNGTSSFVPTALGQGVVYFWRVTAVGPGGLRREATNSPAWFSVPIEGASPFGVAATSKGKVVFVEHLKPGLTIFDPATSARRFVQTTGVDARMVAVTRDGTRAFMNEMAGRTITAIDVENERPAELVLSAQGRSIYGFDVTPDGTTLVAPVDDATLMETVLGFFPVVGTEPLKTIPLGASQIPYNAVLTPDGASALAAVGGLRHVDLATGRFTKIPDARGYAVAVTADGRKAWMTEGEEGGVREIDLVTRTQGRLVPFMPSHEYCGIAISPDGKHGVVTSLKRFGVLDLEAGTVVKTFDVWARCAAISPDGRRAYVSAVPTPNSGKVMVLPLPLP